jgi:hypothetical protein
LPSTLWENLREEIGDPKDSLQGSSEDESNDAGPFPYPESLLVGFGSSKDLSALHPPPVQIFRLWQTFLANVNPLAKMVHHPTLQQTILDACEDIKHIPRHVEALMFSVYFLAVTSLQNEECQSMFGEQRNTLVSKYAHATQQALINARFLKSLNIGTLQAYVLFLVSGVFILGSAPWTSLPRESHQEWMPWLFGACALRSMKGVTADINLHSLEFDPVLILILSGSSQVRLCVLPNVSDFIAMARTTTYLRSMLKYAGGHGGKSSSLMAILQNLLGQAFLPGWQNLIPKSPKI